MSIRQHIPNCITSLNLLFGAGGVAFSFLGRPDLAFALMIAAAACDFLDGFCARLLGAYSDMGRELDSLADLVSFGVLPSVMLMNQMRASAVAGAPLAGTGISWLCFLPLLLAVASGLRLAKFNVDERQSHSFLGLPTPACALFCASLCYYVAAEPASRLALWCSAPLFLPGVALVLGGLLLSEIPMFSMKFSKEDGKVLTVKRLIFLGGIALITALVLTAHANWALIVLLTFALYIVKNLVYALFRI